MLATKPADTSAAYTLAAATTEMMWTCAFATARVGIASTVRSLELWTRMLGPPIGLPDQIVRLPSSNAVASAPEPSAAASAGATPFASYRSSSGHAAAQVAVSEEVSDLAGPKRTA